MSTKLRDLVLTYSLPSDTHPLCLGEYKYLADDIYGLALFHVPSRRVRIDVIEMAFNWRVVESCMPQGQEYGRYWCFSKEDGLDSVIKAAKEWDGAADGEPHGWIKSWDQRIGGDLAEEHLYRMWQTARKLPLIESRREIAA